MKKNLLLILFVLAAAFNLTADILSEDYTLRLSDDGKTVIAAVGKPATVTIPNGVTTIRSDAFYKCTSLQLVIYDGAESDWYKIEFKDNTGLKGKTIVGRNRAAWTHAGN